MIVVGATTEAANQDRRVRKSRAALMAAAVRLVSERGTTEVPVTDLAAAADVSRRVLYQHFGDRDSLLSAAAVDLLTQRVMADMANAGDDPELTRVLLTSLLADQDFYRAILTGSCLGPTLRALTDLFGSASSDGARALFGDIDDSLAQEIGDYFTGATTMAVVSWLTGSSEPDPQEFTDRIFRIRTVLQRGN